MGYQIDKANGTKNGVTNGHSNGHSNGSSNGHSNGYSNGYSNGHSNGYSNGHSNGQSNGHSNGYSDSLKENHEARTSRGEDTMRGYDHIHWYVGNAKQAASYYITRMNFHHVAYQGPETGSRYWASYTIANGSARFVLTSPVLPLSKLKDEPNTNEAFRAREMYEHITAHGDGVKDVAFEVDDVAALYSSAVERGAVGMKKPYVLNDEYGSVELATIRAFGETTHTFVNRRNYKGIFLPGFKEVKTTDPINDFLPNIKFEMIDHFVGNQDWNGLQSAAKL